MRVTDLWGGLLALLVSSGLAGQSKSSAAAWRGLSEKEREVFVFGFKQGTFEGMRLGSVIAGKTPPSLNEEALDRSLTPGQRSLAARAWRADYAQVTMEGLEFETVAATMTALYEDPANSLINFPTMLTIALKRLHGDPQSSIDRALELARKVGGRRAAELKE